MQIGRYAGVLVLPTTNDMPRIPGTMSVADEANQIVSTLLTYKQPEGIDSSRHKSGSVIPLQ